MGTSNVKPNVSGGAGGSRYSPRAHVKGAAKQVRRNDDKKEIKKGMVEKDKKVDEANLIRRHRMPSSGFQPIDGPVRGSTWETGTSPSDILCPTCGEPWDKSSSAGRNIQVGRTDDCPACMPANHPVEAVCATGAIAAPVGYAAKDGDPIRKGKKLIVGGSDKGKEKSEQYSWHSNPGSQLILDVREGDCVKFRSSHNLYLEGIAIVKDGDSWKVRHGKITFLVGAGNIVGITPVLETLVSESFENRFDKVIAEFFMDAGTCECENAIHAAPGGGGHIHPFGAAARGVEPVVTDFGTFKACAPCRAAGHCPPAKHAVPDAMPGPSAPAGVGFESWEPGQDFTDFIDETIDPAMMAALKNNVTPGPGAQGGGALGPNSRLKKLTGALGGARNAAAAKQRGSKELDDLKDEVDDIKDAQAKA